jgi:hypothetical protein
MDDDDKRHRFDPPVEFISGTSDRDLPDNGEVFGILLSVQSTEDPEDRHMFWVYDYGTFESWDEWYVYATAMMEAHGMSLA